MRGTRRSGADSSSAEYSLKSLSVSMSHSCPPPPAAHAAHAAARERESNSCRQGSYPFEFYRPSQS